LSLDAAEHPELALAVGFQLKAAALHGQLDHGQPLNKAGPGGDRYPKALGCGRGVIGGTGLNPARPDGQSPGSQTLIGAQLQRMAQPLADLAFQVRAQVAIEPANEIVGAEPDADRGSRTEQHLANNEGVAPIQVRQPHRNVVVTA